MNELRQSFGVFLAIALWEAAMLCASVFLWTEVQDPFGMLRYVLRLLIVVPLALFLAITGVRVFDRYTPNDWMERVAQNEIACAVVLAALILGVFLLCVQGLGPRTRISPGLQTGTWSAHRPEPEIRLGRSNRPDPRA